MKKTKKKTNDVPLTPKQAMAKVIAIQVEVGKGEVGIKAACKKHDLSLHKYSYWAKKLKNEEGKALADVVKEAKWEVIHDSSPAAIKERMIRIKELESLTSVLRQWVKDRDESILKIGQSYTDERKLNEELHEENKKLKAKLLEYVLND